jgi:hypothetical protein
MVRPNSDSPSTLHKDVVMASSTAHTENVRKHKVAARGKTRKRAERRNGTPSIPLARGEERGLLTPKRVNTPPARNPNLKAE